jgi:hypothetical protein
VPGAVAPLDVGNIDVLGDLVEQFMQGDEVGPLTFSGRASRVQIDSVGEPLVERDDFGTCAERQIVAVSNVTSFADRI